MRKIKQLSLEDKMPNPKKMKFPSEVYVAMNSDGDLLVGLSAEDAYDISKIDSRDIVPIALYKLNSLPTLYKDKLEVLQGMKKK